MYDCNMLLRLAKDTDIGLGESYMKGEYEPDDLTNFLNVLVQNIESCNQSQGKLNRSILDTNVIMSCRE